MNIVSCGRDRGRDKRKKNDMYNFARKWCAKMSEYSNKKSERERDYYNTKYNDTKKVSKPQTSVTVVRTSLFETCSCEPSPRRPSAPALPS